MTVVMTKYGFKWGGLKVDRVASSESNPRFKTLVIHCENGDCVEIISRPKTTSSVVYPALSGGEAKRVKLKKEIK